MKVSERKKNLYLSTFKYTGVGALTENLQHVHCLAHIAEVCFYNGRCCLLSTDDRKHVLKTFYFMNIFA